MAEINPTSMATQLATYYVQSAQDLLSTQTKNAQNTFSALTRLQSALRTFETAISGMSTKKSLLQHSASFGTSDVGTVAASPSAQAGTYSLFVEQIATSHQIAFRDLPAVPVAMGGILTVQLGDGSAFDVDLLTADSDGDDVLSQAEIARAINQASGNGGKVTATVTTVGGQTHLVVSSGLSGEDGRITLDTSGLAGGSLKDALEDGAELVEARDAIVWLGAKDTGIRMQQASNTFTNITGVSMTFTRAMAAEEAPVTLTVKRDDAGTVANVKGFVEAYNALFKVLGELTKTGDPDAGTKSAVFASDTGVRMLKSRLSNILRQDFGGLRLMDLGVSADRNGVLSLNESKLERTLASKPDALDTVFGKSSLTASSGVLGAMGSYLSGWLNSTNGQIKRRQDIVQTMQKRLSERQTRLDDRFNSAYERYLVQFTRLQTLSAQMSETGGIFDNLPVISK